MYEAAMNYIIADNNFRVKSTHYMTNCSANVPWPSSVCVEKKAESKS